MSTAEAETGANGIGKCIADEFLWIDIQERCPQDVLHLLSLGAAPSLQPYGHSPPIAVSKDTVFRADDLCLHTGDMLFVYTDGVLEATSKDEEMFGEERLLQALNEAKGRSAQEIIRHVEKCVDDFYRLSEF